MKAVGRTVVEMALAHADYKDKFIQVSGLTASNTDKEAKSFWI